MLQDGRRARSREGIAYARSGNGEPLLLLHGFPQTRLAWRHVVPLLEPRFSVVAADLPGYGDSDPAPEGGSKRAMAAMLCGFMRELGYRRFAVAGHDRGGRVAYRMALDSPDVVTHLSVLDIVPTLDMAEAVSYERALEMVNWFVLAQPAPFPEDLIGIDPAFYIGHVLDAWAGGSGAISDQARQAYIHPFRSPAIRHSVCEEYRAAASADVEHDRADRAAGRHISCPVLVLWSREDLAGRYFDPPAVWRQWAREVSGHALDCGHFMMEEAPREVAADLLATVSAGAAHSP